MIYFTTAYQKMKRTILVWLCTLIFKCPLLRPTIYGHTTLSSSRPHDPQTAAPTSETTVGAAARPSRRAPRPLANDNKNLGGAWVVQYNNSKTYERTVRTGGPGTRRENNIRDAAQNGPVTWGNENNIIIIIVMYLQTAKFERPRCGTCVCACV